MFLFWTQVDPLYSLGIELEVGDDVYSLRKKAYKEEDSKNISGFPEYSRLPVILQDSQNIPEFLEYSRNPRMFQDSLNDPGFLEHC